MAFFPAQVALLVQGEMVPIFYNAVLVDGPLVLLGFTCAYAFRGLRLLVMCNPHMRKRWKRLVKQKSMVKAMVLLFVLVEGVAWSTRLSLGVKR